MVLTQKPNLPQPAARRSMAALVLLAFLAACGGSAPEKKPAAEEKPKPRAPVPEPAEGGASIDGWIVLGENPKWKPIKPLFETYAKREVTGLHNPMRSNLTAFVEKPVPTATRAEDEVVDKPKEKLEDTPFTRVKLGSLTLIVLVTGVAQPKAVLLDGEGNQLVVMRGDHLGSEGGVVKAITQYELQVSVPGEPDVVKSLKPPLNPVEELDAETQGAGKKPEL